MIYLGDDVLDLFFFFGSPKEILSEYTAITGRAPVPVTVYGASRKPEVLEEWAAHGVTRAVYWLPSGDAGEVERAVDAVTGYVESYRGG